MIVSGTVRCRPRATTAPFSRSHLLLLSLFASSILLPFASASVFPSVICPSDPLATTACNTSASTSSLCPPACQCAVCPASPLARCYKTSLFQAGAMRDALGSVLIFSVSVFSAVAGIGGGAMMTPILISVFGFNLSAAKMLSHIAVFGNVCAQVWEFEPFIRFTSHPHLFLLFVLLPHPRLSQSACWLKLCPIHAASVWPFHRRSHRHHRSADVSLRPHVRSRSFSYAQ
jgi:hypothetical protein